MVPGRPGVTGFRLPQALSPQGFLDGYWQRKALVCPGALVGCLPQIDADDLLDIACEPQADARLVVRQGLDWQVRAGPLDPSYTEDLPETGWSVLIQSMEVWLPELHDLVAELGFLPRWRTDDVMVSLSAAGGGVGPHVDQYDVFLVQASGRRCWAYGGPVSAFLPDRPLRLLADFRPEAQHVLEPGDTLYLPPGVPHDGVALDDGCLTVSIGFRAPGASDLASKFADQLLTRWQGDVEHEPRFADPGRPSSEADPTRIDPGDAEAMAAVVSACLNDPDQAMRLTGELMSEPRMPSEPPDRVLTGEAILDCLADGGRLERWAGSRLAHGPASDGRAYLFADGTSHLCTPRLAAVLAAATFIESGLIEPFVDDGELASVLAWLVGQGTFAIPPG
jgi:50S ribosomal protein L16 3-hydroxylase